MKDLNRFIELFVGGGQAHGLWDAQQGAKTVRAAASPATYREHLAGGMGLGLVPIRRDGTCRFAAIDIDIDTIDHQALQHRVAARRMPLTVCRSKSGAAHLYLFAREPGIPAEKVIKTLERWAALLGHPGVEIFPKQSTIKERDSGNWINLPYFADGRTTRYAVGPRGRLSLREFLDAVEFYDPARCDADETPLPEPAESAAPKVPIVADGKFTEGRRNETLTSDAGSMRRRGFDQEAILAALLVHNRERCEPPLPEREVRSIATSVSRYPPGNGSDGRMAWVFDGGDAEPEEEPAPGPSILFPEEALVGLAADFAQLHAEKLEAPVEAFYFSYLTMLGAALSRHVRLETALNVQPRLYTVLLGESATAKKSTAIYFADTFFQHLVPANAGRAAKLFPDTRPPATAKPFFKMIYGLGSAEGIARAIKEEGLPLLLCFDELKVFVDKTKQEGSVGLPMINILFEQNYWDNYTVKKTIALRDAYLSFLAASTTATYESMWTSNYLDIGFLNRLFTVLCARTQRVAFPRPLPQGALEKLAAETWRQISTLTGRAGPTVFEIDGDADELWREWYVALEDTVHARRLDTIGMRLMLLLAVTTGAATVTRDIVARVIAILDYELRVRRLTDPIDAENAIAKLEEAIRRCLREHPGLTQRQLQQRIHAHRYGIWFFKAALKNLTENEELHVDKWSKTVFPGPRVNRQ